ncbi:MAG: hypothetical protein KJZ79_23535 [Bryobacteraceae bacterium]|nr:hypothetical protein [Bryobacteraceae bacterium]
MAGSRLHILIHPWREEGSHLIWEADLRYPGFRRERLWFRVSAKYRSILTELADPFLVGCFQQAMAWKRDLVVEGAPASAGLLSGLERAQALIHGWWPRSYRPVDLCVERVTPAASATQGTLLAFSGGVDSSHSAWVNRGPGTAGGAPPVTAGLMVQGFDIPLGEDEKFAAAAENSEKLLGSLGLPLIRAETNLRVMPGIWLENFGSAVAAALHLFSGGYRAGMLASGHERDGFPHGSAPGLDPEFGSEVFDIFHDGAFVTRLAKIEALAEWPEACARLRVCWRDPTYSRNCGRCEKCLRTLILFRVAGKLPSCFPGDVDDGTIRRLRIAPINLLLTYQPLLEVLRERGIRGTWVTALEEAVARGVARPVVQPADRLPNWLRLWVRMFRQQAGLRRGVF